MRFMDQALQGGENGGVLRGEPNRSPHPNSGRSDGSLVRKGGLEPPRVSPPDPKSGASANSATLARYFPSQVANASLREAQRLDGSLALDQLRCMRSWRSRKRGSERMGSKA